MEDFIRIQDVCRIFKVKERTVYRWIEKGMPCYRPSGNSQYRFLESEVRGWYVGEDNED